MIGIKVIKFSQVNMIMHNEITESDNQPDSFDSQMIGPTLLQRKQVKQVQNYKMNQDKGGFCCGQKREVMSQEEEKTDLDISSMQIEQQYVQIYQKSEFKLGVPSIHTSYHSKLILFFDQQALLINLYTNKWEKNIVYFVLKKDGIRIQELPREILKLKVYEEMVEFFRENENRYSLIPITVEGGGYHVRNFQFVIGLFKRKYLKNASTVIWKVEEKLQVGVMREDLLKMGIVLEQLNEHQYMLIRKSYEEDITIFFDFWERKTDYVNNDKNVTKSWRISPISIIRVTLSNMPIQRQKKIEELINKLQKDRVKIDFIFEFRGSLVKIIELQFLCDHSLVSFIEDINRHSFQNALSYPAEIGQYQVLSMQQFKQSNVEILDFDKIQQKIRWQQYTPKQMLKNINTIWRNNNITQLLHSWKSGLYVFIEKIIRNWQVYKAQLEEQMILFTRLIEFKIQSYQNYDFQLSEYMYEGIGELVKKLLMTLKMQNISNLPLLQSRKNYSSLSGKNISCEVKTNQSNETKAYGSYANLRAQIQINEVGFTQQILKNYINYKKAELENKSSNYLTFKFEGRKQNLSQFISDRMCYQKQLSKLRDLFEYINFSFQKNRIHDEKFKQISLRRNKYMQEIEFERIMENRCLGCSTFFISGMNIQDDTVLPYPVRSFNSVERMKNYQSQIKDDICAMLNSQGGIILFDCSKIFEKIIIRGIQLSLKDKEQYEQRMMSYIDVFEPKIEAKKCIKISFVPVLADPYQGGEFNSQHSITYCGNQALLKKDQVYRQRPYIRNTYVMRVRVCPNDGSVVFYWNQNSDKEQKYQNKNYVCTKYEQGKKVPFKLSKINHLIKRKIKKYYLPDRFSSFQKMVQKTPVNYFNHECREPEAGTGLLVIEPNIIANVQIPQNEAKQNSYEYASLLIVRKQNIGYVKNLFISDGIDCHIECKFSECRFRSAKNTAVMYHNNKFDDVLFQITRNPSYKINDKALLIISVTGFVRLNGRNENIPYTFEQLCYLREWVHNKFPHEQLRLYEFLTQKGGKEYYLQTDSYDSTIYIYFVLNSYNEKSVFKNPLHLDKMSQEQKMRRWRQIYSYAQVASYMYSSEQHNCQSRQEQILSERYGQMKSNNTSMLKQNYFDKTNDGKMLNP